jgi:hypothetical protein
MMMVMLITIPLVVDNLRANFDDVDLTAGLMTCLILLVFQEAAERLLVAVISGDRVTEVLFQ